MSKPKPNSIQRATITYFHISMEDLLGTTRDRHCVTARHVAWYIERKRGFSYSHIARLYGGRDHTTIIAAMNHVNERVAALDERYLPAITAIDEKTRVDEPLPEITSGYVGTPVVVLVCPTCGTSVADLRRQLDLIQRRLDELGAKP